MVSLTTLVMVTVIPGPAVNARPDTPCDLKPVPRTVADTDWPAPRWAGLTDVTASGAAAFARPASMPLVAVPALTVTGLAAAALAALRYHSGSSVGPPSKWTA